MHRALPAVLVLAMGCHREQGPAPSPITTTTSSPSISNTVPSAPVARRAPSEQTKELYASRCGICHGPGGGGDGPAAANLEPKPQDERLPAWQASVTDQDLATIIVRGGQAVGKSATMPGNPDLEQQPELVQDLVTLIRGFATP